MATAFTAEEKEVIKRKLHTVAKECLQRYGVKKTTVDQMAAMVEILIEIGRASCRERV